MTFDTVFGTLVMLVLNVLPWVVALNKSFRGYVAKSNFWVKTDEDRETAEAVAMGLGVVFGLFFNIISLAALIGAFGG
jgi:Kef-type K+ transport system membrane component KefB